MDKCKKAFNPSKSIDISKHNKKWPLFCHKFANIQVKNGENPKNLSPFEWTEFDFLFQNRMNTNRTHLRFLHTQTKLKLMNAGGFVKSMAWHSINIKGKTVSLLAISTSLEEEKLISEVIFIILLYIYYL